MGSYKPVNAVIRGMEVLAAVNKLKGKATVGEIHRETAIDKATIVRMLETLMHAGYVYRDDDRTMYEVTGKTCCYVRVMTGIARSGGSSRPLSHRSATPWAGRRMWPFSTATPWF